jgi:Fibronectin type III domain
MKRLLFAALLLAPAAVLADVSLSWGPSDGATGYNVYCAVTGNTATPTAVTAPPYVLTGLTAGTSYDCYVTATATLSTGPTESGPSNTIRFTPAATAQTIVIPTQPSSVTISWQ